MKTFRFVLKGNVPTLSVEGDRVLRGADEYTFRVLATRGEESGVVVAEIAASEVVYWEEVVTPSP